MTTLNKQIQLALEIAVSAHRNVTRGNGDLYITYVLQVASNKRILLNKTAMAAALLYDVIKKTPITLEYLKIKGVSDEVLNVLTYLIRNKEMNYETYISNLCNNLDAMLVKLAYLDVDLDTSTLEVIGKETKKRLVKYETAKAKILTTLLNKHPEIFNKIYK